MFVLFPVRSAAFASLLAAVCTSLWAIEPLTLAEAQRIAVLQSRQLVAQDALAAAARDQAIAAGQLPDPVLKLGLDSLPLNGPDRFSQSRDSFTMRRIGISQEITGASKRLLRTEKFEREAERLQAQRRVTLANVQRDAALAWVDRHYAQAQRALLQQQFEETRLQVQVAESVFRTNRGSQADVFAARAAVIGMHDRLSQIGQQSHSAALTLARWLGTANAERPTAGPPPWQSTRLEGDILGGHLEQHPGLLAISAEVGAAESDARLAQANRKADISVEASFGQRSPAFSNLLSIGISIPLQWDQKNRQDQELGAKLALVDEVKARYEDALRSHEADVRGWLNDWQTGKERVARLRNELIPVTRQRYEAALTAYRTGKGDLAATLAARRDEIEAHMQALNLEMETARSWARINFLVPDDDTTSNHTRGQP